MTKRVAMAAVTVGGLLLSVGCQGLAAPPIFNPGPAELQQARAERFDPYPENEPGPEIVGGRPLDYDRPPAEPLRSRWLPWSFGQ